MTREVFTLSRLQEKRKAAGLSQSKLADRVGMSVRVLQHYEQGSMDLNKAAADMVYRLAVALGCQMAELLDLDRIPGVEADQVAK